MIKYLTLLFALFSIAALSAQSDFGAGINLGADFPVSDFDKYYETGYGGDAHFLYHFGNQAVFSLSLGYNIWDLDVEAFNKKADELGLNLSFDLDSDFKIIPVLIGVKWYFIKNKKHSPYIQLEGGVYNYQFTFKGTASSTNPAANFIQITIPEINESGTETMLTMGLGYLFHIGKKWLLDFTGKYNFMTNAFTVNEPVNPDSTEAIYGVKGTLSFISITAGINYRF